MNDIVFAKSFVTCIIWICWAYSTKYLELMSLMMGFLVVLATMIVWE